MGDSVSPSPHMMGSGFTPRTLQIMGGSIGGKESPHRYPVLALGPSDSLLQLPGSMTPMESISRPLRHFYPYPQTYFSSSVAAKKYTASCY